MNARTSLIPSSTDGGYGAAPSAGHSKKESGSVRSRVLAAAAGVRRGRRRRPPRQRHRTFAAEGEGITFDKVLAAQVRPRTTRKDLSTRVVHTSGADRDASRVDRARRVDAARARDRRAGIRQLDSRARRAVETARATAAPGARVPEPPISPPPATPPGAPGKTD